MQDILLPFLVLNLLLTFWLLRQHILRQDRRHRRRNRIDHWLNSLQSEITDHGKIHIDFGNRLSNIHDDLYDIKNGLPPRLRILEAQAGHFANFDLRLEKREAATLGATVGDLRKEVKSIEVTIDDFGRRFNDLWAFRNSHEMLSATVETLRIQHYGLVEDFSQTKLKFDNRIVDLENGTKPFNQDTLIDSLESDRQEEAGDPVKYGNRFPNKHKQAHRPLASETPVDFIKGGDEKYFGTDYSHDIIP